MFGQKKNEYKFKEPETTACFVCGHVLNKERSILYTAHDNEGDWQFLCGQDDHTEKNAKLITLKQVTVLDPTVNELYEMPENVGAQRKTIKDKWIPFRMKP